MTAMHREKVDSVAALHYRRGQDLVLGGETHRCSDALLPFAGYGRLPSADDIENANLAPCSVVTDSFSDH